MKRTFIPALGLHALTPLYDPLVAITTRERASMRLAAVQPGERLLDVGCGTGALAIAIKQVVLQAAVTGMDVEEAMLARARRKARSAGIAVEFFVADWGRADGLRRLMFYVVQLVDGFAGTQDNVAGLLPGFFARANFEDITLAAEIGAPLGSIVVYRAVRPATRVPQA